MFSAATWNSASEQYALATEAARGISSEFQRPAPLPEDDRLLYGREAGSAKLLGDGQALQAQLARHLLPDERVVAIRALPVVTTAGGKGAFPESHPLALGVFGNFGGAAANAARAAPDARLVVGSKIPPSHHPDAKPPRHDPTL